MINRIRKIMWKDSGVSGDAQRIEQMTWMFFLKIYDTQEETWEYRASLVGEKYISIIPEHLRWRNWAIQDKDGNAPTGEELLNLVNNDLFPTLKALEITPSTPPSKAIVKEVFEDINQYMKNGVLLRQVINVINEKEFDLASDRHEFGYIYEEMLKELQTKASGEFYTPRALTDFIVKILDPKLGETFADFAAGTGGFLTSALNHLKPQIETADKDLAQYQNSVIGQEWKPLPYLLSITNLMLHDVEAPNLTHCDSLGTNINDFKESDCVDVIAMNPPYGGSTEDSVKKNFPTEFRSSETAVLFMALIMKRLKKNGRAGVILSDGFLNGQQDGANVAVRKKLLSDFNLHTIIRLPGSIFSPYTGIPTNILFFNNERAKGSEEGLSTKETWFYRLDMPEGIKHFSKTKPMLLKHCQPIFDWWDNRKEIILDEGDEKARVFTAQQLIEMDYNFDQCKFPIVEEEVLEPADLLAQYFEERRNYIQEIDYTLAEIQQMLGINL